MNGEYQDYQIDWQIEVSARSPEEAAALAQKMMQDYDVGWTFDVYDATGKGWTVMLNADGTPVHNPTTKQEK